jgi:hypothetical protein
VPSVSWRRLDVVASVHQCIQPRTDTIRSWCASVVSVSGAFPAGHEIRSKATRRRDAEYAWCAYGDPLTPLEREVIAAFLTPADPVVDGFRAQLEACRIKSREFTGVGFYTQLVVPQAMAVAGIDRLTLSGVAAAIDGLRMGAGFVLFVQDGMLDLLEGFTYDGPWPDRVEGFDVRRPTSPDPGTWMLRQGGRRCRL